MKKFSVIEMKSKHKAWAMIIGVIFIAIFGAVLCLVFFKPDDSSEERVSVRDATVAIFEFIDDKDKGYKLFTSEIATFYSFDSLRLEPSEEEFSGDWIYRIIFNPKSKNEIVILFGENNLSVNGRTYMAAEGVDYTNILNWAKWKYDYYDYELRQELLFSPITR